MHNRIINNKFFEDERHLERPGLTMCGYVSLCVDKIVIMETLKSVISASAFLTVA
jgi:hypothetical protein